jgi:hypothetical protein
LAKKKKTVCEWHFAPADQQQIKGDSFFFLLCFLLLSGEYI